MDDFLKRRGVGITVLVALGVIFIPMLFDDGELDPHVPDVGVIPPALSDDVISRAIRLNEETIAQLENSTEGATEDTQTEESTGQLDPVGKNKMSKLPNTELFRTKETTLSVTRTDPAAWAVQLGSFSDSKNASSLAGKLREAGYAAYLENEAVSVGVSVKVRVGPELKREDAERLVVKLKTELALKGILVRYQ